MTAWILTHKDGMPICSNVYDLYIGMQELGEECKFYTTADMFLDVLPATPDNMYLGHIGNARRMLRKMNIPQPEDVDYPQPLIPFLKRNIWKETLYDFHQRVLKDDFKPLFIKSVAQKYFTGFLCENLYQFLAIKDLEPETQVFVSEPVKFKAEFRTYIHRHEIAECLRYYGQPWYAPDESVVKSMLYALRNTKMPLFYSIDVGIVESGETVLVECNDGFALGNYGLNPRRYAQAMMDRWNQIVSLDSSTI